MRHSSLLITAHPGHELLLHHWLECQDAPIIMVLTDGSGRTAQGRTDSSRKVLAGVGAVAGPVFGAYPDRQWYDFILRQDPEPFLAMARQAAATVTSPAPLIVADPVEHFNPMHDLAAVIGHLVSRAVTARGGEPRVATYAIEKPGRGNLIAEIVLDEPAQRRKTSAIEGYTELAEKRQRVETTANHYRLKTERLHAPDIENAFPENLEEEPYYEIVGRARRKARIYSDLITYAGHVRPLVRTLMKLAGTI